MSDNTIHQARQVIDPAGQPISGTQSIWNNGVCDVELVSSSIEKHALPRLEQLSAKFNELASSGDGFVMRGLLRTAQYGASGVTSEGFMDCLDQANIIPLSSSDIPSKPETFGATRSAVVPLVSDVWNGVEPMNYHVCIKIGTPPEEFSLDIDSGSSLLWVQSVLNAGDRPLPGQKMYCPAASGTVHYPNSLTPGLQYDYRYADMDKIRVSLLKDKVAVGDLSADAQTVGTVTSNSAPSPKSLVWKSKSAGILGLGFPSTVNKLPKHSNLVQTLAKEKKIKFASFSMIGPRSNPKSTAEIDKSKITQPRGHFVIGAVDKRFYTGELVWCQSLVPKLQAWVIKLDKIKINGTTAFTNQYALIDTNSSYILASQYNFIRTMKCIPGSRPIRNRPMFKFPKESLSSISFTFGDAPQSREFKLHRQDFSLGEIENGSGEICSSIVRSAGIERFGNDFWVLGGIFIDNVVAVFDYETKKIGFADIPYEQDFDTPEWAQSKL